MTAKSVATRTLEAATRLRLRGRPWSWIANVAAAGAAGALSTDDVRQGAANAWERYDPTDVGRFELMAWERHLIDHVLPPRARLLVIGSGAGRDLVAYAQRGFTVTGIEPAPIAARTSREQLQQQGLGGTVLNGFAEDVTIDGTFDAVIFSYFCYAYVPGSERRVALLRKLQARLGNGASIVLTYNARSGVMLTPLTKLIATLRRSTWRPEHGDSVYLMGRVEGPFLVEHLFNDGEIVAEAARAGYHTTFDGLVGEVRMAIIQPGRN